MRAANQIREALLVHSNCKSGVCKEESRQDIIVAVVHGRREQPTRFGRLSLSMRFACKLYVKICKGESRQSDSGGSPCPCVLQVSCMQRGEPPIRLGKLSLPMRLESKLNVKRRAPYQTREALLVSTRLESKLYVKRRAANQIREALLVPST